MSAVVYSGVTGEGEFKRLRTLYHLLSTLSQARALEDVYEAALTSLLESTAADRAAVLLFDEDGVLRFKASRGLSPEYQAALSGHSPWTQGVQHARPLVVVDTQSDQKVKAFREALNREGIGALVALPLALDTGVFGNLMMYYAHPHDCPPDELEIAQAIAAHLALATQHKRAELARIRSEQRFQAILDNSATIIFLKDREGRYQLVNSRYEELFHVSKASMVGRTDRDLFPPEIAEQFEANDRAVLVSRAPLAIEEYAPHDDGMHTYLSMKFPLEGPDGEVTGVCGIATDITERKRLEMASQRLAAIVESSDDAIISKDLNGLIASWNTAAERMFGYAAEEVMGKPVSILAPPGHLNEMPEILAKIRQGQRVENYETQRRRKDGRIIDVALTVSPVRDSEGRIVGASKIARDITEKKQAERERAVLLAREREARRTAELLNRVGPRLAAQLDLEKLVQEVTDIATALLGAEVGAFVHNVINEKGESDVSYTFSGRSEGDLGGHPMFACANMFAPTLRGEPLVRCDDVTQDPRYADVGVHGDTDPALTVRSYLATPVISRSRDVLGGLFFGHSEPGKFTENHIAIVTGIAAQSAIAIDNARLFEQGQWTQAELKRSNEELRRANRDLEVLAYSASHDLQEPLRTIAISAQLIERKWGRQLQGEDATFLANILGSAKRMRILIDDLLAYTRATKYEEGAPQYVDPAGVLGEVVKTLQVPIQEAKAEITAGDLPPVRIHEARLAQLLQNLISNAIKYRGKEVPRVRVSADERDGWCVFSVADNGIGIEPQFAEQIFGLFKRLHGRDEYPGSGIGLAICQRIVEQYGGRIWLESSTPGCGSVFCFALPSHT